MCLDNLIWKSVCPMLETKSSNILVTKRLQLKFSTLSMTIGQIFAIWKRWIANLICYPVNVWLWFRPHAMNKSFFFVFFLDFHVPLLDKYFLHGQDTWSYLPQTNTSCTFWIVLLLYAHNSHHINNQPGTNVSAVCSKLRPFLIVQESYLNYWHCLCEKIRVLFP